MPSLGFHSADGDGIIVGAFITITPTLRTGSRRQNSARSCSRDRWTSFPHHDESAFRRMGNVRASPRPGCGPPGRVGEGWPPDNFLGRSSGRLRLRLGTGIAYDQGEIHVLPGSRHVVMALDQRGGVAADGHGFRSRPDKVCPVRGILLARSGGGGLKDVDKCPADDLAFFSGP